MIREVKFESQDRRIKQILAALNATVLKILKRLTLSANLMDSILIKLVKRHNLFVSRMQNGLTW